MRGRGEDVALLVGGRLDQFVGRFGRSGLVLSTAAMEVVKRYPRPGTLRELRNVIERAALLCGGPRIEAAELGLPTDRDGPPVGLGGRVSLAELAREHIRRVVASTASFREAAEVLGIDETTLWRKRKQYDL